MSTIDNNYQKTLERASLRFGAVKVTCPHCHHDGYMYLEPSAAKFLGKKTKRVLEMKSIDCICLNCEQKLRISNGSTIKRNRRLIEINHETLTIIAFFIFLFGIISLFFPSMYFSDESLRDMFIKENRILMISISSVSAVISGILFIYTRLNPLFLLQVNQPKGMLDKPLSVIMTQEYKSEK